MACFGPGGSFIPAEGTAPREIPSVANCRVIRDGKKIHTIAGLSGSVRIDPAPLLAGDTLQIDRYGKLSADHAAAAPKDDSPDAWWWD